MGNNSNPAVVTLDDKVQYFILKILKISVFIAIGFALYFQEYGAVLYSMLALLLMFIPRIIRSQANIKLPIEYEFVLVVFMFASVFLGKVGEAYERFWWWDAALHTSSGFILGFVAFLILYIMVKDNRLQASKLFVGLAIVSFAVAMGALWEIFEFAVDGLAGGDLQKGSLQDTMWDLVVDSIGAVIIAVIGAQKIFGNNQGLVSRWTNKFVKLNPKVSGGKTRGKT